jgi:hypothetical protein
MLRLFERFGNDNRDGLPIPTNLVVLQNSEITGREPFVHVPYVHEWRSFHLRGVFGGDDRYDAWTPLGIGGVDSDNPPLGDRAADRNGIGQIFDLEFRGEARFTLHLPLPVNAADGRAEVTVFVDERVRRLVGHELDDGFHKLLQDAHLTLRPIRPTRRRSCASPTRP